MISHSICLVSSSEENTNVFKATIHQKIFVRLKYKTLRRFIFKQPFRKPEVSVDS